MDEDRSTPKDIDAEKAALGSCLLDPTCIPQLATIMGPPDFYMQSLGRVFAAILEMVAAGEPVDIVTVSNKVAEVSAFELTGTVENANPANAASYARIVAKAARDREVLAVIKAALYEIMERGDDPLVVAARTGSALSNLTSALIQPPSEVKLRREVNGATLQAEARDKGDLSLLYLTMFRQERFFVKGWSHILAGFPKSGKTEFIVRVITEWSEETALFISEEPKSIWEARLRGLPEKYSNMTIYFGLGVRPKDILDRIKTGSESVVVVDTLRNILGLADEKDNSEVARAMIPFIAAARERGKTLIFLHHTRKGSGDHGEGIAGAHAFLGVVDVALELRGTDKMIHPGGLSWDGAA